jgi:circadian clock protein KaiB
MSRHSETLVLRIYVNGTKAEHRVAAESVRELLEYNFPERFDLQVIDIMTDPDALEEDDVLATPTLVRREPDPRTKIVGDFSDEATVLRVVHPAFGKVDANAIP